MGLIYVQRNTSAGAINGAAVSVASSYVTGGPASIAMDGKGKFVVVWGDSSSGYSVLAQRFTATGKKVGSQFVVGSGLYSNVAMNSSGQFVVAWSDGTTGLARRYNADGSLSGGAVSFPTGNMTGYSGD